MNPFSNGKAISPNDYIESDVNMLKEIVGRIINQAQATAIVSEPCFGKTSLLYYLHSPKINYAINQIDPLWKYSFQFVDSHLFQNKNSTQQKFWEYALSPLGNYFKLPENISLRDAYQICQGSGFDIIDVESLLREMEISKIRLVLLVDEFDDLLPHPVFGSSEFLAGLRSFSTRIHSLPLIIASRMSVSELNKSTRKLHSKGSPYFNHFYQVALSPFSDEAIDILFKKAGDRFSRFEKEYLVRFAGRHPYFLQLGAHSLWESYENDLKKPTDRLAFVWKKLCDQSGITLNDTWDFWDLRVKQLFAVVVLNNMRGLIGKDMFDTSALSDTLNNCTTEIEFLMNRGFINPTDNQNRYSPGSQVLTWWLTRRLIDSIQDKDQLGNWLMAEHREGIIKTKHRELIMKIGTLLSKTIEKKGDVFLQAILQAFVKQ